MINKAKKKCEPGETRTPNLLIRSEMLYPLSHGSEFHKTAKVKKNAIKTNVMDKFP